MGGAFGCIAADVVAVGGGANIGAVDVLGLNVLSENALVAAGVIVVLNAPTNQ